MLIKKKIENKQIEVSSEVDNLRKVILHRPGEEFSNVCVFYNNKNQLKSFLIEDIVDLKQIKKEHKYFVNLLKKFGIEVLFIEDLIKEVLENFPNLKIKLIDNFITTIENDRKNYHFWKKKHSLSLKNYFLSLKNNFLIKKLFAGVKKTELNKKELNIYNNENFNIYITKPLVNLIFQRDSAFLINNLIFISQMASKIRERETLFSEFIFKYNPRFKNIKIISLKKLEKIEGGDIQVLNKSIIIVGITKRTNLKSVKKLKEILFINSEIKKIIVLDIKVKSRQFMHLDTFFSCVDYDKNNKKIIFLINPLAIKNSKILIFNKKKKFSYKKKETNLILLKEILQKETKKKVIFINCGGKNYISQENEAWTDGCNILVIRPKSCIGYQRNRITNKLLEKNGIKVHKITDSELSRLRGGAHCMSMPIYRKL